MNGNPVPTALTQGYVTIDRKWKKGDVVVVDLPMAVRRVVSNELVKDDKGLVALEYGPVVYCAEGLDNDSALTALRLPDDAKLTAEMKDNLLQGVTVLTGKIPAEANGVKSERLFTAIPYYAWSNRGTGTMKVWLPRK